MSAPSDEERQRIKEWLDATTMCDSCNRRVPTTEVEAGEHDHPAVMD